MKVDIHIQKGDYGWMISRRDVKSKKEAFNLGANEWDRLMKKDSDNPYTKKAFKELKKEPYRITVMPMDAMRGTVMFEDFGKFPSESQFFKRVGKGLKEVI